MRDGIMNLYIGDGKCAIGGLYYGVSVEISYV